ncbi:MAG TPA: hypothetical protein VFV83_05515 [Chthoniobacteraceae bacterium]|nr:hypothetical protein [Chthoniobacteraceae bacterium]
MTGLSTTARLRRRNDLPSGGVARKLRAGEKAGAGRAPRPQKYEFEARARRCMMRELAVRKCFDEQET